MIKKILIVGPSWIGDTVMSNSLCQLLTMRYHRKVIIDVLTPMWCRSVLNYMSEVNRVLLIPYKHGVLRLIQCFYLGRSLQDQEYHQAIILPNSFKSALIPFFAGITIRTGWKGETRYGIINDLRVLDKAAFPLMVQRYAALAYDATIVKSVADFPSSFPWPRLSVNKKDVNRVLYKFNLHSCTELLIGLCPGAASELSKVWPHYHYITLSIYLICCGYHVVVLGSLQDQSIRKFVKNDDCMKGLKHRYHCLIGQTSLDEAISIISVCQGIVSNDSGLMHIACALKRPVVGLYGSSDPYVTPPLFDKVIILRCINKYYKTYKGDDLYGYHHGLIDINPDQVFQALHQVLSI